MKDVLRISVPCDTLLHAALEAAALIMAHSVNMPAAHDVLSLMNTRGRKVLDAASTLQLVIHWPEAVMPAVRCTLRAQIRDELVTQMTASIARQIAALLQFQAATVVAMGGHIQQLARATSANPHQPKNPETRCPR